MLVESVCPYCGCGCKLGFEVDNGKIIKTLPVKNDFNSKGKPCIKGLTCHETVYKERLNTPLVRRKGKLVACSWQEAYKEIKKNLSSIKPEEIYFTGSASYSNETNYLFQKFAKRVFKTKNIDSCARLCHAATGIAFNECFGINRVPDEMDDVLKADVIFTIGTNPSTDYPVFFDRIQETRKKGAKLISVDIDPHDTSVVADISAYIKPESLIVFLSGLIHGTINKKNSGEGYKNLKDITKEFSTKEVSRVCGIKEEKFKEILKLISNSKNLVLTHGMGLTQRMNGTQNVRALTNIGLLNNARFIPLRGKINVQGAGDMGCSSRPINYMTTALFNGDLKAMYVMGMDPAKSFPNLNLVHKKMRKMFIILQHTFPTETMKFADVVLPSSLLFEEDGTVTTGESRVQRVNCVTPPIGGKKDWEIICDLAKEFGIYNFNYKNEKEIFSEIVKVNEDYSHLTWDKVSENKKVFTKKKKKYFHFVNYDTSIPREVKRRRKDFVLTTMRSRYHFCTGEATLRSKTLRSIDNEPFCHMNKKDAVKLGLKDGDKVEIKSIVSSVKIKIKIDPNANRGTVTLPYHFDKVLVNKLFPSEHYMDPISGTPNFKAINVDIKKAGKN